MQYIKMYTYVKEVINIKLDITNNINDIFNIKNILNSITKLIKNKISNTSYSIDRFEGNYAVCENLKTKEIINIPILELPKDIKESDIITKKDNVFYIDKEKINLRKEKINELTKDIFEAKDDYSKLE